MSFNSYEFLLFFPIVCIIYFLIPSLRYRNLFLLASSYYFYMNWEPVYALLLLTSTGLTYLCSLGIEHFEKKQHKKLVLGLCIAINLSILFFFKYFGFLAENITQFFQCLGIKMSVPEFKVLLPVGISFYVFQALGYSIDVYRKDIKAERNFFTYALFVSFFPQLVAGPIERSTNLLPQFYQKHSFDGIRATDGLKIMLWGYFMKLVVADRCAEYVDAVYNHMGDHAGYSTLIATFLFSFQLYGDFAGYTFIAIGAAKIMGFKLMDNFMRPYFFSVSIQDYWKRNHISLTTWFMDYVYYPLTTYRNTLNWWCFSIFITFFISGLWHGAAWTFVIWGTIHGLLMVVELRMSKKRTKFEKKHNLKNKTWYVWTMRLLTYIVVSLTLVFFRANTLNDATMALRNIFTFEDFTLSSISSYVMGGLLLLFLKEYMEEYKITCSLEKKNQLLYDRCWMAVVFFLILNLGMFGGGKFIYFQF